MTRHIVARVDELPPGSRKVVTVGGREVGVFNVGGEFFAVLNRCPHQAGPLCQGTLVGELTSSKPGEYEFSREGEILKCPWHQWEFDLRTGQSWFDPNRVRVRQYRASVVPGASLNDDDMWADPQPETPAKQGVSDSADRVPGPYVAETYPAIVEDQYVLVELGRQARGK